MLVLTRRLNQSIIIGRPLPEGVTYDVEIVVTEIRGDQVRIGITAPASLSVDRKEVWLAKKQKAAPPPK